MKYEVIVLYWFLCEIFQQSVVVKKKKKKERKEEEETCGLITWIDNTGID